MKKYDFTHHWLWVAYTDQNNIIYGCVVHNVEPWAKIPDNRVKTVEKIDDLNINVIQVLIDNNAARSISTSLNENSFLDLSRWNGPHELATQGIRVRLSDGFGRKARRTEAYSSADSLEFTIEIWRSLIQYLKSNTGISFETTPDRLQTFEVFDSIESINNDPVFDFQVERDSKSDFNKYPKKFQLKRLQLRNQSYSVLVELELNSDWVFSKLFSLKSEEEPIIEASSFSAYKMSVFSEDGSLIQFDEFPLLLNMGFNMGVLQGEMNITDKLSQSAKGLGGSLRSNAQKVRTKSTTRSLTGVKKNGFDLHSSKMRTLIRSINPPADKDRWFHRGISNEIGVIDHFNKLLDGGRVKSATIVDPFFSADALSRVISRIESLDVEITVVTSLSAIDPDTNQANENLTKMLTDQLEMFSQYTAPNAVKRMKVVNLVDGSRQAFHDRYLSIIPHEGDREIYLLSNSINRMAGNWPFCMSLLDTATAKEVAVYIDNLVSGIDISGSTNPEITFVWPEHAS